MLLQKDYLGELALSLEYIRVKASISIFLSVVITGDFKTKQKRVYLFGRVMRLL